MMYMFKRSIVCLLVIVSVAFMLLPISVYAEDLGSIGSGDAVVQDEEPADTEDGGLIGYMKNYSGITDSQMDEGAKYASPIVDILGSVAGFALIVVIGAMVLITALDLAYIAVPLTRGFLAGNGKQLVSDEALASIGATPSQSSTNSGTGLGGMSNPYGSMNNGLGGYGNMNNGLGGYGGMSNGYGGMNGGMGTQSGNKGNKVSSAVVTYLKKRTLFLVIFAVAAVVLTSSILTNCGINIASLLIKVVSKINEAINGISI